jgi:EpsG family
MLIYLITFFIVVLTAYIARRSRSPLISRFFLGIALATMVLTAGLRDRTVGTDTGYYVRDFGNVRTFTDVMVAGADKAEYGFWAISWFVHLFSDQYMYFLFAIALIFVSCHQWAMVLYSKQIEISFYFFIASGIYTTCFNPAREGIACAIYALSMGSLIKGDFKRYLAWVILASFFHRTALVAIPAYFVINRPNNLKTNAIIVLIGIVTAVFFQTIMGLASGLGKSYADYASQNEGGGYFTLGVDVLTGFFLVILRKSIHIYRDEYDLFLNMFLFSFMITIVSVVLNTDPSGIRRLTLYFAVSPLFLWPIIFKNLTDRVSKFFVGYFYAVCYLVYFVLTTQKFSDLVPYVFNPSIISR